MSYINWGNESKEQLEIRKRIEQEMIFEQMSAAAAAAAAAAGSGGIPMDPDAKAFSKITELTSTQSKYVNILVKSLKKTGIWEKLGAIYPMIGGNATAHSYNLKDTTKFRLTFYGGWTHSANGAKPNGTNAYATTGFNPITQGFSNTNAHVAYYVMSNNAIENGRVTGISNGTDDQPIYIIPRYTDGKAIFRFGGTVTGPTETVTNSDARGFYQLNRIDTTFYGNKNDAQIASGTQTISAISNLDFYLGTSRVLNYGNYKYSSKECGFASFGNSLTLEEADLYNTAVQQFQTNLERQL